MNPTSLLLNNNRFSYEQIKRDKYIVSTPFEKQTLLFCQQWLNGQQEFEQKTSGSTGKPKTIKIARAQMELSARLTVEVLHIKPNDVALVCIDTAYIGGKMMLVRALEHQLQLIIQEPSSNPLLELKQPFDFAAMVPMQVANSITTSLEKIKNCKAIIVGGAPVGQALANQLAKLSTPIFSTYGMTETVSHIALKRLSKPVENYFTTLGDTVLNSNKKEQLVIKGSITNNKKLLTNDRVQLISPTQFKWLGRIDYVINSGGVKIQLEEIESKIERLFISNGVLNRFFLQGVSDEKLGQKLVLCIENAPQIDPSHLSKFLKPALKTYTYPKETLLIDEFTVTKSGKINRTASLNIGLEQ